MICEKALTVGGKVRVAPFSGLEVWGLQGEGARDTMEAECEKQIGRTVGPRWEEERSESKTVSSLKQSRKGPKLQMGSALHGSRCLPNSMTF